MIRPPFADERPYILRSWIDSHRYAPGMRNRRWRDYKAEHEPLFNAILDRADTRILVKVIENDDEDLIVGWICWSPGTIADAIHWSYTRWRFRSKVGEGGAQRDLWTAMAPRQHVAFTFRGAFPHPKDGGAKVPSEAWLVPALAKRGIGAAYVPYREWSR